MALLGKFGDDYTRTGKGTLTGWSNFMSYVPRILKFEGLKNIPIIGGFINGTLTALFGAVDTVIESGRWLLRGQIGSAITVAAAGAVSTAVNANPALWWANAASGVATGETLGTHARALTETVIGKVTGALGVEPQVLKSYPVGIGSIGSGAMQGTPGKFASKISGERGQNADEAYQRYVSGEGGVHVSQLNSANGLGA
ncbi:MAG: hypothetical protein V4735_07585 [Pseudomonadota bacterium]